MNRWLTKRAGLMAAGMALLLPAVRAETLVATADIVFRGSSTLHDFEGMATSQPFKADFQENAEDGTLTVSAKTTLNVAGMTTDSKKRDRNMYNMFDIAHFANIEGQLPEIAVSETDATKAPLHLKICDVEQDVTAIISNVERNKEAISCTMTFPVSLKAFNLKGPSVMGFIRVDDTVQVECNIKGKICDTVAGK